MGVSCIVFDNDGMLFECFLHVLCYFQHLKKNGVKKISGGGGDDFFTLSFHFAFYAIFNIKKNEILKSAPSLAG